MIELITRALQRLVELRRESRCNEIWVSEIASCLRKSYYERVNPQPVAPEVALLAEMSKGVHKAIESAIELECSEIGCSCESEKKYFEQIGDGIYVVARPDLVCRIHNSTVIIEIKMAEKQNNRPDWIRQIRYYAALLNANEAYLLIISRNGKYELRKVTLGDHDRIWRELKARALLLYKALRDKKPPRRERGLCQWCVYKFLCLFSKH